MRSRRSDSRRRSAFFLGALLLSVGMFGCALMPPSQGDSPILPTGNSAQPSAQIRFCNTPGINCVAATSFSISKLRDLNIVVKWSNLATGNHAQILTVLHAAGGAYQSFHKGFMVSPNSNGSFSTSASLPVAGTWIVQRSMVGVWTVEAFLDGRVVARQSLTLAP